MAHFKAQAAPVMAAPNIIPMADIMLVLADHLHGGHAHVAEGHDAWRWPRLPIRRTCPTRTATTRSSWAYPATAVSSSATRRPPLDQISSLVRDRISNRVDKTVFIKSDGRAKYGDVVKLVDEVRSAGVDNVGLLTDKAEQDALRHRRPTSGTSAPVVQTLAPGHAAPDSVRSTDWIIAS